MYISEILYISNYRNLTGKKIKFNETMNFIIGENNIGKTNVLELLNIFLSTGKFMESDFTNVLEPIQVKMKIKYSDDEVGFFEDNFDVDDSNSITLIAEQDSVDERINYFHDTPNQTKISTAIIKKINTLYYYAQRMPSKEVDFRKSSGSGKVLNYLIQYSLKKIGIEEKDIIEAKKVNDIIKSVNEQINKLNTITGDNINTYLNTEVDKIISKILGIGDENGRNLSELGQGVQYAFNILLQIIETIYNTKTVRKVEDFKERLIIKNEKKYFPIVLIIDEPEIHQHPYRQRNLIKKIQELLKNENEVFIELLKSLFNIDGLIGQIFIATHSPNILLNDYKQFIRVYKSLDNTNSTIEIKSGMEINFDNNDIYKHILHNFIYLKEAMFSKYVIFVEGDTEYGAIPVFTKRMNFDLDEKGVGVVKLDGANNVKPYMKLYKEFGIMAVAIIDKDKKSSYGSEKDVFFTTDDDYESDIYNNFKLDDYLKCCKALERQVNGIMNNLVGILKQEGLIFDEKDFIQNPTILNINDSIQEKIMKKNKTKQLEKLKKSKNAHKGAILALYVTVIPPAFKDVIEKVMREVK